MVIDDYHKANSSLIAAGMFNPIVFKRLNKSWMADDLMPQLNQTYSEVEELVNASFLYKKDIIRIFASVEQQNDWMIRSSQDGYEQYLSNEDSNELSNNNIPNEFGFGIVKEAGWVNTTSFLKGYRSYLSELFCLMEEPFSHADLALKDDEVEYKGIKARKLIFCEGDGVRNNPLFSELPFVPTKGELLTLKIKKLNTDAILNKGFFMLPLGDEVYKVGATYNWKDLSYEPTEGGREELLKKVRTVLSNKMEIIDHTTGIRPATKDRRPIIGLHKHHNQIGIFNGLGTKGVMLAPYFAKQFTSHLIDETELNKEVDVSRFY